MEVVVEMVVMVVVVVLVVDTFSALTFPQQQPVDFLRLFGRLLSKVSIKMLVKQKSQERLKKQTNLILILKMKILLEDWCCDFFVNTPLEL